MMMAGHRGGGCERKRRARKWNAVLLEELFDAGQVRADDSGFGDHQRLVPIADVVCEQSPFLGRARLDEEHRLRPLGDDDHGFLPVDDQAVTAAQDRAPRKRKTERDSAVRPSRSAHVQSVFPSERDRVASVAAGRWRQRILAKGLIDDGQNRKYRCASGSTSAGSLVSS